MRPIASDRRGHRSAPGWTVAYGAALVVALCGAPRSLLAGELPATGKHFVVETNDFLIGQAPDWIDDEHVVWQDPMLRDEDGDGAIQVHSSRLDGSEKVCLTCNLEGPNQVPVAQPGGDWILFHSWVGHTVRVGSPGFGGLGSDVWVMRRDGSQQTNLTQSGDFEDNFHAYWSPDGQHLVWTALNWNAQAGGDGKSDVRVARFDPNGPNGPRLVDEHVVRPGNGHWYETQWWAPDGSGFLYTETADTAINPELYFCRLEDPDHGACRRVRMTHDPAWDEQAIFTPDMSRIIFMSSRNLPGAHNDWAHVATLLNLPAKYDYAIILSVFSDSFLQPILEQATDLYEMTLDWNLGHTLFKPGAIRRLTQSGVDAWVIPEFAWDPSGQRLLWTQSRMRSGVRVDQGCVNTHIRDDYIRRLERVRQLGDIPFTLPDEVREQAADLVRNPKGFVADGLGCGGDNPQQMPKWDQQTLVARFLP